MKNRFLVWSAEGLGETYWQPVADVYRTRKGWLVKFDLAGVRLEDIQLSTQGHSLTLDGVRRDLLQEDCCDHYSLEISYSQFKRSITLPIDLENATLRMDYTDGMLFIAIDSEE